MVTLKIDGQTVKVKEGTTIMEAARSAHIHIPHLCYLKDLNEIAACRVCCVEVKGEGPLVTACNNPVSEGMEVFTNSPRARATRKINVELILSQHDCKCATCMRSGNCQLQKVANELGISDMPYESQLPLGLKWNKAFPLYHDYNKCIKCMRCVQVCDKVQSLNIWDMAGTGGRTWVDVSNNRLITESDCSVCGQCVTHCPVAGLRERDDTQKVFDMLARDDMIKVVQVAPAVRAAWGEAFGLPREKATMEKMATALKRLGFDYVFDTNFTADLTIMEEANEFIHRLQKGDLKKYPMFTSCCPAWVRFMKSQYPDLTKQLSTAKSPQQMFGSVTKSWFADKLGVGPSKIFCVSIMPCMAKKAECDLPTMKMNGIADVDLALTTREFVRMLQADKLNPAKLPDGEMDNPLGEHSGAGVIFGATGGVMEAALRTAVFALTGKNPDPDMFTEVRTGPGLREANYEVAGIPVRCAVVSGLGNARTLMDNIVSGKAKYDFVEVMACPGGCAGGGGQPIPLKDEDLYGVRGKHLYDLDKKNPIRFSHENPEIKKLYDEFLGKPLSEKSEELLHTNHLAWEMPSAC